MSGLERQERSGHLEGADGARLHYRAWGPDGATRAGLAVVHGLAEHSRRYRELAVTVGDAGIAAFALDLRGHGSSEGRRGYVQRFGSFLEDVERFRSHVASTLGEGTPVFLLAHSMGGLVGLRYVQEYQPPLAGAILSAPWLRLVDEPAGLTRVIAGILARVWPTVSLQTGLDPAGLSHDPERVADYVNDPEIFSTITPRLHKEVQRAAEIAVQQGERIDLPVLFLLPGADPIVDTGRTLEFARSLEGEDVTIRVLDGYYHEPLQEVDRAQVMAGIVEWVEERLG